MTEHVLPFDRSVVPQETSFDCGPASTQVVLNVRGVIKSEADLINDEHTTINGTDDITDVTAALNFYLPEANYTSVHLPDYPPSQQQKDQFWVDATHSVDCGYGLVLNFDAPPSNYPIGVKGSPNPTYGGGEVMHYVSCVGYDDTPGGRALLLADPGFSPFVYWISFEQACTLIPPKGYSYADAAAVAPPPVTLQETPVTTDTLFADVSEFQAGVDDSYPYPVLSIRVCDGTYQDHKFVQNYAWMRAALDSGRLVFGIVYTYVRPGSPSANAATVKQMIDQAGGLHPRVALMLDVESGGNPPGDQSAPINSLYAELADYAGNPARVIGYANGGDFAKMWPTRPPGLRVIGAGYGSNPNLPGQVAHQYTDGTGFSPNLPQGCPPFGNCDMNSADGLSPQDFAAACGIGTATPPAPPAPTEGWTDTMSPSPQDVLANQQGTATDGTPQWWNVVYGRHLATFGSLIANAQKGPWNEPLPNGLTQLTDVTGAVLPPGGVWDHGAHMVLAAEQLAWRYADSAGNIVDLQSMIMALWEYNLAKDSAGMHAAVTAAKVARSE